MALPLVECVLEHFRNGSGNSKSADVRDRHLLRLGTSQLAAQVNEPIRHLIRGCPLTLGGSGA